MNSDAFAAACEAMRGGTCAVALTGAGISAESGIPTFRGANGIWTKYPPEDYASIDAYMLDPDKVWKFWCELAQIVRNCKPNPGHFALAQMEAHGKLHGVITQNVDNLHQAAGSTCVVEYHGNAHWLSCLSCDAREALDFSRMTGAPHCRQCAGLMKPDVVMFGEDIPMRALVRAQTLVERCDVLLVIGTSASVFPAAQLPRIAKSTGAVIIEINTEQTECTAETADIFLEGGAGDVLSRLAREVTQSNE